MKHSKVLIIGSGPAGYTAAIYTARAMLKPTLVQGMQPGGQLTITTDVENYPGFGDVIQGPWLMQQMEQQAKSVGTDIITDMIKSVDFSKRPFTAIGESGETYTADSIIISTGAQARWLGIDSEKKFSGFGVSACATCDGFFFKDKEVIVVGGGNSAVEEALYLTGMASKVYLVHRRDELRAEKILQERVFKEEKNGKIEVLWNTQLKEVLGDEMGVNGVLLETEGSEKKLNVMGVFIAIGHKPNTDIFSGQLDMDNGYIQIKSGTSGLATSTSIEGVFAAGDVSDQIYRQAVTSAGFGCMAALDAEKYLSE